MMMPLWGRWSSWCLGLVLFAAWTGSAVAQAAPAPRLAAVPPWLPRYDLDVHIDVCARQVHVRQEVTWTNHHQCPATELVFNAHSHYRVPSSEIGLLAKTLEILRMNPDEGMYTDIHPLEIQKILIGGAEVSFRFEGDTQTNLVVPLPEPVAAGKSVTVVLLFTLHLPQKQGRWGQWQGVTFLSNWLPVLAVYDEQGWHPTPFIPWHQPFFNEAGVYRARVVLPADQKLACTGAVQAARPLEDGWQEVLIAADGVRDFALLSSARYVETTAEAATVPGGPTVRVRCLAFPEHEHYARRMLQTVCEVMPFYSRCLGPYPYPEFTIAESYFGWNGNECSTLVMIDERVFGMPHIGAGYVEYLIAHETCHQWWYNLIGTNGYCETWLDEAMATYLAHKYLDQRHGLNSGMIHYPRGLEWLPNIRRETYRYSGMFGVIGRGEACPTVQELPRFGHVANLFGMCYDKGSKIVGMIEDRLGEAAFLDFLRRIYDRYSYRILRLADFQRELEEYTGRSWEEFFRHWLYGAGLCDWSVEKVHIAAAPGWSCRPRVCGFLSALAGTRARKRPCKVTVVLHQKGDYDEATILGFCLEDDGSGERMPFQVRIPILPQAQVIELPEWSARVEVLPDHRVRVEVLLPSEPVQIAVDPDSVLVDRNPCNNWWKPRIRWRLTPLYTLLDEADLTTDYDRWNVTSGLWLYGAAYSDPWYTRATMVGVRAGLYRSQHFQGGVYAAYRTDFRDIVMGLDGLVDHWPWPRTQVGFNVEHRLTTLLDGDAHPSREVLFGRYIFQYNSSLYLPPIHHVEMFVTNQGNFLPFARHMVPGAQRYENLAVLGLHYHLNYLTPYWDPQGGFRVDLSYRGGVVELDRHMGVHQVVAEFSHVKGLPDLSGHLDEAAWPGKVVEPVLRWLGETRLATRAYVAAGVPDRGQYFPLGGGEMFRGFTLAERQGSLVWLGSVEWRFPILRQLKVDAVDHVVGLRNLYGALFYDVGDAYVRGHSVGPVAHGIGAGLRFDVTWFGFVERTTLRFDVGKAVNVDAPVQFQFGANMPF